MQVLKQRMTAVVAICVCVKLRNIQIQANMIMTICVCVKLRIIQIQANLIMTTLNLVVIISIHPK